MRPSLAWKNPHMGYQLIMKRDLEPDLPEPDITRGTLEAMKVSFRRQSYLPLMPLS